MIIGIIVHSFTGNTLFVAEKLKDELTKKGHTVKVEQIKAVNETKDTVQNIQLESCPKVDGYDALVFGAPVRGFSLSPIMNTYLMQLPSLEGKKIHCYVTQHLKKAWMGGNRSIRQMQKICEVKGGTLLKTGDVHWSSKLREEQINGVIQKLSCFSID